MAKSIKQIRQELETLESQAAEAGKELQDSYAHYLELLSQSAKQQLILASYQLCTQVYPENFLSLSLSQKEELQQQLKALGKEIQPKIIDCSATRELHSAQRELDLLAEMVKNLPITSDSKDRSSAEIDLSSLDSDLEPENKKTPEINTLTEELGSFEPVRQQQVDFKNPEHLVLWHKQVEKTIKKTLDDLSREANKCLQEANIIPSRLPPKIIEVALQAEEAGANGGDRKTKNLPNILSLVIEADKEKKSKPTTIEQIDLLRLRLSEIEFTDTMLSVRRNKIRTVVEKIAKLRGKYRSLKEVHTVAEAEAAWRATWYED